MPRPQLSDAEKMRRGTFRADLSEAVYAAKRAEKVVVGPWLREVPKPEMPLNDVGTAKYEELAKALFENNKLTMATVMDCQMAALLWQGMQAKIAAGKIPSTDSIKQFTAITQRLRIAEDAPPIKDPNQKSRFEGAGFSNRRATPIRLR